MNLFKSKSVRKDQIMEIFNPKKPDLRNVIPFSRMTPLHLEKLNGMEGKHNYYGIIYVEGTFREPPRGHIEVLSVQGKYYNIACSYAAAQWLKGNT